MRIPLITSWLLTAGLVSPLALCAQSGTSLCNLPQYRGTAIYAKYCSAPPPVRNPGPSAPSVPAAPSPEELAARELNTQGLEAYGQERYDDAVKLFQQALAKVPNQPEAQQNLAMTLNRIAYLKQLAAEAFTRDKLATYNHLKNADGSSSAPLLKGDVAGDGGLKVPVAADQGGLKPLQPQVLADTHTVDVRNLTPALSPAVDHAVTGVFAGAAPGVSERVRKAFQAVEAHDWKLAQAWLEDALNRDPNNVSLQRLIAVVGYTGIEVRGNAAAGSSLHDPHAQASTIHGSQAHVQLPNDKDMELLFPGWQPPPKASAQTRATSASRDPDMEFLFPSTPTADARELNDYVFACALQATENDPALLRLSQSRPVKPGQPHTAAHTGTP